MSWDALINSFAGTKADRINCAITILLFIAWGLVDVYGRARRAKSAAERRFYLRWVWGLGIEHVLLTIGVALLPAAGAVALMTAWGLGILPTVFNFKRGEARYRAEGACPSGR